MPGLKYVLFSVVFLLPAVYAHAHQPNFVMNEEMSAENPYRIEQPGVSKAYYGRLKGRPDYYKLILSSRIDFYINILVPDLPAEKEKRYSVDILDEAGNAVFTLNGGAGPPWRFYHEEFGNDDYYMGPEATVPLAAGKYTVRVYSAANDGKYTLATGKAEWFGPLVLLKTLFVMPRIKKEFFGK